MNLPASERVARRPEHERAPSPGPRRDPRAQWAEARVGSVVGDRWMLTDVLGSGATSAVFRAQHRNGNRVAVKMLHPELARDREVVRRFVREAYIANRVEHPGVVRILDDGVDTNGAPFLVMELVDGSSLSELVIRDGPFAAIHAARIVVRLLDVLAAAHAAGVVHRDVKPANVILSNDASVRILDFGIARLRDAGDAATRDGWVLGTPAFMSPEQAAGVQDRIDARADVWSTGALLYTLLTGRTVRDEATTPQHALLLAMEKPVPPMTQTHPGVPSGVASVVDRALLMDPRLRWPSAVAMKEALERVLRGTKEMPVTRVMESTGLEPPSDPSRPPSGPPGPLPLLTGIRLSPRAAASSAPLPAKPSVAERPSGPPMASAAPMRGPMPNVGIVPPRGVAMSNAASLPSRPPASASAPPPGLMTPTMIGRANREALARITGVVVVVAVLALTAVLIAISREEPAKTKPTTAGTTPSALTPPLATVPPATPALSDVVPAPWPPTSAATTASTTAERPDPRPSPRASSPRAAPPASAPGSDFLGQGRF